MIDIILVLVEKRLPWGVILLLGGGFALADVTEKSGLSQYLVDKLDGLKVFNIHDEKACKLKMQIPKDRPNN